MWWIFVVIGVLLMALEVLTPGFLVMWFGVSFIVAAIPVYLKAPFWVVMLTYAATLLVLTVFVRKIFAGAGQRTEKTGPAALMGEEAVVVEVIDAVQGTGRVRAGKEVWSAISEDGSSIEVDRIVRIKRIDGVKLVVAKKEK